MCQCFLPPLSWAIWVAWNSYSCSVLQGVQYGNKRSWTRAFDWLSIIWSLILTSVLAGMYNKCSDTIMQFTSYIILYVCVRIFVSFHRSSRTLFTLFSTVMFQWSLQTQSILLYEPLFIGACFTLFYVYLRMRKPRKYRFRFYKTQCFRTGNINFVNRAYKWNTNRRTNEYLYHYWFRAKSLGLPLLIQMKKMRPPSRGAGGEGDNPTSIPFENPAYHPINISTSKRFKKEELLS